MTSCVRPALSPPQVKAARAVSISSRNSNCSSSSGSISSGSAVGRSRFKSDNTHKQRTLSNESFVTLESATATAVTLFAAPVDVESLHYCSGWCHRCSCRWQVPIQSQMKRTEQRMDSKRTSCHAQIRRRSAIHTSRLQSRLEGLLRCLTNVNSASRTACILIAKETSCRGTRDPRRVLGARPRNFVTRVGRLTQEIPHSMRRPDMDNTRMPPHDRRPTDRKARLTSSCKSQYYECFHPHANPSIQCQGFFKARRPASCAITVAVTIVHTLGEGIAP